jgi:toxin YoeB
VRLLWGTDAWADYLHWQTADRKILSAINALVADIDRHPFEGIGKPEPLWRDLSGWWSRRITREHRLVYRVVDAGEDRYIEILSCRFHYYPP